MRFVLGVLALVVLLGGCGGKDSAAPEPDVTTGGDPGQVSVPVNEPVGLVVVGHDVWAVSAGDGTLVELDPSTGRVMAHVAVGATPLRASYDGRLIWVSVFGDGQVVAVDPDTRKVVRRVAVDGQPEGVATAFGSVWVVRQQARELTRISPAGKVLGSVPLDAEPRLVLAGQDHLWVSDYADGTITRVTPAGRKQGSFDACPGAQGMAEVGTTLWVTCTSSDQLVGLDEATGKVTTTVPVSGEPDGIVASGGSLWLVATDGPTLLRLDPANGKVVSTTRLGESPALADRANDDLARLDGRTVISSFADDQVLIG